MEARGWVREGKLERARLFWGVRGNKKMWDQGGRGKVAALWKDDGAKKGEHDRGKSGSRIHQNWEKEPERGGENRGCWRYWVPRKKTNKVKRRGMGRRRHPAGKGNEYYGGGREPAGRGRRLTSSRGKEGVLKCSDGDRLFTTVKQSGLILWEEGRREQCLFQRRGTPG